MWHPERLEPRVLFASADPVGYWPLDEGSGTVTADASVNGNAGALAGGAAWSTGRNGAGTGLRLDGVDDRVTIPDAAALDVTGSVTLAAWVAPARVATQYVLKKAAIGAFDGYELSLSAPGNAFVRFNEATRDDALRVTAPVRYPSDGRTWVHLAATYDGAAIRLYVNGRQVAAKAAAFTIAANDLPLTLGAEAGGRRAMAGGLDDARVYDRALSAAEVAALAERAPQALPPLQLATTTADKPQSKLWFNRGTWWGAFADASGTWAWRLDGTRWAQALKLSDSTTARADARSVGDVTHVLLLERSGKPSQLASIEYVAPAGGAPATYRPWSARPTPTPVTLSTSTETATIEIDGAGRLWLASDASTTVKVRYSDAPYAAFSDALTLASGVGTDDICAIASFPDGSVGVMWSNQVTQRFGFRAHAAGAAPDAWSADELPASQSAIDGVGLGMADDHLNVKVAADGTLYAAVKTSYDTGGYPRIALLVRRPAGTWDDLYVVSNSGTRPIVLLNEFDRSLTVAYRDERSGNIVSRRTPLAGIAFGPAQTLIPTSANNVTSTKQNFTREMIGVTDDLVVVATDARNLLVGTRRLWPA